MNSRKEIHSFVYLFGLIVLVIGLPLSKFLMSIAQIILVGNWLIEGNIRNKIVLFWKNKSAVLIASIFLLHLLGLWYTSNFQYALNDIRIKLPLFLLPLIISSTSPLTKKQLHILLSCFCTAVIVGTFVSTYILLFHQIEDTRNISPFISHIRFGLNICVAIYVLIYFILFKEPKRLIKIVLFIITIWLIFFLFLLESITGIIILVISSLLVTSYYTIKQRRNSIKIFNMLLLILIPIIITLYITYSIQQVQKVNPIDLTKLEQYSNHGEKYKHNFSSKQIENGNYVWIYVAWEELEKAWNQRSELAFKSKDKKGQPLYATIIRFLSSKGFRKDAEGVARLSREEIQAIERGVANVNYMNSNNFQSRINQIIWEVNNYIQGGNPEGNSVTQRFEFWKAAVHIIKENILFGVGTGDVQDAYNTGYSNINTPLSEKYWLRAHNQYLTMWVAFGLLGFLWFMFAITYPLLNMREQWNYFFIIFLIIALLSFINEDTLETQAGATFFAFFYSMFLFGNDKSS